mgnify:CR=1 FL=1
MSDTTGPADPSPDTPETRLRAAMPELTRAERQLAMHMLGNYPMAVLGSVASLARGAGVSGPTVVRLVQKLGYSGYPDFQAQLREEVGEKLASPIAKREKWAGNAGSDHVLDSFGAKVIENVSATLGQIDHASFDAVTELLADRDRRIAMLGAQEFQLAQPDPMFAAGRAMDLQGALDQPVGQSRRLGHLGPRAVVEDPRLVRVRDALRGARGRHHELDRLVVRGDEDVDRALRR